MRIVSSEDIETVLLPRELVETLRRAYRSDTITPDPTRQDIERVGEISGKMRLSPAWTNFRAQGHTDRGYIGCGITVEVPAETRDDAVSSVSQSDVYMLFSGQNGRPIALFDGARLAQWRQSALHALAVHYLSRADASYLLILDPEALSFRQLSSILSVRDIRHVLFMDHPVTGASPGSAEQIVRSFGSHADFGKIHFSSTDDLKGAVTGADVVLATDRTLGLLEECPPPEGSHISVVGDTPNVPDSLMSAARLFVGDRQDWVAQTLDDVAADLRELAQGQKAGRRFYRQITLFAGGDTSGLADFATAGHVFLRS